MIMKSSPGTLLSGYSEHLKGVWC